MIISNISILHKLVFLFPFHYVLFPLFRLHLYHSLKMMEWKKKKGKIIIMNFHINIRIFSAYVAKANLLSQW